MGTTFKPQPTGTQIKPNRPIASIEKALLIDVCLGVPLGQLTFSLPAHFDLETEPTVPRPETFLFRSEQLRLMKALYARGDRQISAAVEALAGVADELISTGPFSVIDKSQPRFSDDRHYYQSLAKYWWPNPDTSDGLPYVRRDGDVNPECYTDDYDYERLAQFSETVVVLALAEYLTGQQRYGQRAALLLETWFINPETRQHPTFEFGQRAPGHDDVRWQSVVESRPLIYVTEAVEILASTASLTPSSRDLIKRWFSELLTWLLESEQGKRARKATNNIGFWYDLQCMVYARFCGKNELVEQIVSDDILPRFRSQVTADGAMPRELERAAPMDYVAFTLVAMALISRAGEEIGLRLWDRKEGDGHGFQVAHDWLLRTAYSKGFAFPAGRESSDFLGDVDVLLDTGLKLRAFQRLADIEHRAATDARAELSRAKALLRSLESHCSELKAKLRNAEEAGRTELERFENRLSDRDALISRLSTSLEGLRMLHAASEANLREVEIRRQGESERLQKTIIELNGRYQEVSRELVEARTAAQDLKARLQAEEYAQQAAIERRDLTITLLNGRLDSTSERLKKLSSAQRTQLRKLQELQAEREELTLAVKKLTRDRQALLDYSNQLESMYRSVTASKSWRLTAPMRAAVRRIRSILLGKALKPGQLPTRPTLSPLKSKPSRPNVSERADGPHTSSQRAGNSSPTDSLDQRSRGPKQPAKRKQKNEQPHFQNEAGAGQRKEATPNDPLQLLLSAQPNDEEALKREYLEKHLNAQPDNFVLYRIIGNDLVPRHKKGQTRENLHFLLENEPPLTNCEKRWIVNRIVDPDEEERIVGILQAHSQEFIHIPFVKDEYRAIGWDFDAFPEQGFLASKAFQQLQECEDPQRLHDRAITALYRLKNNYLMNNNGARNVALHDGRQRAKWVLPWDGNCFVTTRAWEEIRTAVTTKPHLKYFVVPMERIVNNGILLHDDFVPHPVEEPQLLFRRDAREEFNPEFPYGRRSKVELFWRLGIPGPWDRWRDDPWDQKRQEMSPEAHQFGVAGWVARMFSGVKTLEQEDMASFKNRGRVRQVAILTAIDNVDRSIGERSADPEGLAFYRIEDLDRIKSDLLNQHNTPLFSLATKIAEDAERALSEPPYSVTQKTTLPPSGDPHDYWHPAPYWWPNPETPDGLPYTRRDGQRVPGTRMYEPESEKYDRTRLQLMFDNTVALALGWYLTGRREFAAHGAQLVRTWFLNPATRMNPHLRFAQVRRGHNNDEGYESGIIELKDLYYFLDAVRILEQSGSLGPEDTDKFRNWLTDYLLWLETSRQGKKEVTAANNHGTYFDLQVLAILSYLEDQRKLRDVFLRAQTRIKQQFTEAGEQPAEMARSMTQHYVFFNLQGWLNIFLIAYAQGLPTGPWTNEPYRRLSAAFRWIMKHDIRNWPYQQIEKFDDDRVFPLIAAATRLELLPPPELRALSSNNIELAAQKAIFNPHDAVRPYWNVARFSPNSGSEAYKSSFESRALGETGEGRQQHL